MVLQKKSRIELYVIQKVKELREKNGLNQAELAFKLDVSLGFIGQVESSNYPAKYNLNHLNKLAEIFSCSPKDFLPADVL
jgi:transcriptional regulator with XRE-family HTH domain